MASDSTTEIAKIQAATAGLSLIKALIDYSASDVMVDAVKATQQWIIREGISEASFNACRELAADCAHPNRHGLELQRGIDEADKKVRSQLRKGTLQLVVSGSLGRLAGRLPELAWMVTTVAALITIHPPEYVTDALCSMILDQGGHEENVQTKYEIRRTLIRSTIDKVVESIFLNVTNVGHKLNDLPSELSGLHSHLLSHLVFAAIVMSINRNDGDAVIKSTALLLDLTSWLLFHFEGILEVYVQSKLCFKERRGNHKRRLCLMIESGCESDSSGRCSGTGHVEVSIWSGTSWRTFVKGEDARYTYPVSYQRHKLYHIDEERDPLTREHRNFSQRQQNAALHTARVFFRWLFNLPLTNERPIFPLLFRISRKEIANGRTVGDLFSRHPWLAQKLAHTSGLSDPVIDWGKVDQYNASGDTHFEFMPTATADFNHIVRWIPILADLLEDARLECSCVSCVQNRDLHACQAGCVRHSAFKRFALLLVHGLCDAVGAKDVTGDMDNDALMGKMVKFLREVITRSIIQWHQIFSITGPAILGRSADDLQDDVRGTLTCAAMQHGSLVAYASWLDISADLKYIRPFSLSVFEGNIQGLLVDHGIVFCETSDRRAIPQTRRGEVESDVAIPDSVRQQDQTDAEVHAAVFASGVRRYRLMTCIESGSRLAVVDPSRAIAGYWQSKMWNCPHRGAKLSAERSAPSRLKVYDFETAFNSWNHSASLPPLSMTTRLDTHLKLNTLLSFDEVAYICNEEDGCLNCILDSIQHLSTAHQRIITFAERSGTTIVKP